MSRRLCSGALLAAALVILPTDTAGRVAAAPAQPSAFAIAGRTVSPGQRVDIDLAVPGWRD